MDIKKLTGEGILLFDGGLGTMLQARGLPVGELPELYNMTHGDVVAGVHREYAEAGSQVVSSNTFQSSELKLTGEYSVEDVVDAGVRLARRSGTPYVALDVGPLGQLLDPMGPLTFDRAYELFRRQMVQGEKSGADCILLETFSDLLEVKAAILAAKENTSLPVLCSLSYQADGRTFMGCDPLTTTLTIQGLGVDALGVNCSLGPKELLPIVDRILRYSRVPVLVQANAGLPEIVDGETVYNITPEEFCTHVGQMLDLGVSMVGGCCGTTPEFIRQLAALTKSRKPVPVIPKRVTAVTSSTKAVVLDRGVSVIGERINPTGKKKLKAALRENDLDYIIGEAIDQGDAGADLLDVNVGLPELDEPAMMRAVVKEIQSVSSLPLQIDSSDPAAIEAGVRCYNGKPLINSASGKQESMEAVFPIVKKYGAAVVCLTLDEDGIPPTAEGRFAIAEKLLETALSYGVPREDVLIDCLVLTASAQQKQVLETLRAIQLVKSRLGLKTVLGVSNVSFGLPAREALNATFLAAAFGAGLDAPILNPLSEAYMRTVSAFRVLNSQDRDAAQYIENYGGDTAPTVKVASTDDLRTIILQGRREEAAPKVEELLASGLAPLDIVNGYFVPALDEVGAGYESGRLFLPQLMQSAEAVKSGFTVLKERMETSGSAAQDKGAILLATVQGDIHDIGKNIVKMILENYGYRIVDLGKDVPVEEVVETIRSQNIKLAGLSALMTTTVKSMQETIAAVREAGLACTFWVGGAVLNEEYAQLVGADFYAKDAMESVAIANRFFGHEKQ